MRSTNEGRRNHGRSRRLRAVTLMEMLTIAAIMALLASLLLPSLSQARQQNKRVVCQTRMKGLASASRVYSTDDPNGMAIPVRSVPYQPYGEEAPYFGAYEWGGKSGVGQTDFLGGGGSPLDSKYGTKAGAGPTTRPLNDVLYVAPFKDNSLPYDRVGAWTDTQLDLEAYRCPSDNGPPRGGHCPDWIEHSERSSYDHFGNSYAANIFMLGSVAGGPLSSNSPYLRPLGRVPAPARTLYYEENIGRWAWAAREDPCDFLLGIDPGSTKVIRGWHGADWTYNRAFIDTHVEYQRIYINGTEDADGYANHYRSEHLAFYPPWDADGDGIPEAAGSFEVYRCVIVRGSGWAKDTLPASPLATGLNAPGEGRPSYEDCVAE